MNKTQYYFSLFLITSLLSGAIFLLLQAGNIPYQSIIKRAIVESIGTESIEPIHVDSKLIINIPIKRIVSERYLYTLTKVVEATISKSLGKEVILDREYSTFDDIRLEPPDLIFVIGSNTPVRLAMTSYFFDVWNKGKNIVNLPEVLTLSGTGNIGGNKKIALTFDDGPSEKYTNNLLDILKKENIRATFFVLGKNASLYPKILQREYSEGHEIGNHSYSHANFTKLSPLMIQNELYETDQAIYRAIGIYPHIFRPPYGATNSGVLAEIFMPSILWSIDTRDWKTHNIQSDIASVEHTKEGDIIILHDIHEESVASVANIITILRAQGFTFVTISELLSLSESNQQIGKKCTKRGSCK
ncbi:polysaccharide deacetylase family protein [Candidatus Gracilibacteria bacterium]|nr:polysaccharide deacetylase family protein [Candidatus Gracilibacteria bacterium]